MSEQIVFEGRKNYLIWPFLDFETTDDIVVQTKYRLQFLFSVMKGERLGNITYGHTLWMRVFNQLTDTEKVIIETEILRSLKEEMPDLIITEVFIDESTTESTAIITIAFIIPKYDNIEATFSVAI